MTEKQLKLRSMGFDAAYLSACALHNVAPEGIWTENLDGLYQFCTFHRINAITAMALEESWRDNPAADDTMKQWRQGRDKAIRKNVLLNAERHRILAYLEAIGCWYMPLKGSLIQFDYPKFGMRQMGDNDILVDAEKSEEIYKFMIGSGYTCQLHNQGNHDEFIRQPIYNIEIHRSLFKPETAPVFAGYYHDIYHRSEKDAENGFGRHLKPEDFYIYLTAHSFNHFRGGGVGIRHLMDVYVYAGKHPELDWAYIEGELDKMGAAEFDRCCRYLAETLFAKPVHKPEIDEAMMDVLDAIFASGAFGTEEQLFTKALQNQAAQGGKVRYFLRRIFPSQELLGIRYPFVKGRKWLVPFVWIYRLVSSFLRKPGRVIREIRSFFRKK